MEKLDRRKFIGTGIASTMGILIFPGIGCKTNNKIDSAISVLKNDIPEWFSSPRFYTVDNRIDRPPLKKDWITKKGQISDLVKKIADNGGSAFRLGLYWGGEVFYQSKIAPHAKRIGQVDYLREAMEQGIKSEVKIVAYMNPNAIYEDHPLCNRCAIRDNQGNIWNVKAYGGRFSARYGCINNPEFREFLLNVLKEIFTEYGPDGFYVDGLSPHVCFCENCKAKYRDIFNTELPLKIQELGPINSVLWAMTSQPELVGDPQDPHYELFTQYLYRNLIDITRDFTTTVKSIKSDAVALYHSWPKPDIIQYYDGTLGEINIARPWIHDLWKVGEMTNYGAVFSGLLMLQNHGRFSTPVSFSTSVESCHKAYQIMANGMFPNFWNFMGMNTVFSFLRENEKYYDYTKTSRVEFIALVRGIRTDAVQRKIEKDYPVQGPRDRFLAPYIGCYSAMMRTGLPVVTIHRFDFHEKMRGFKVLCLINEASISDQQADAVRNFVAEGGGLIATGETSLYDQKAQRRVDFALKDLFGVTYEDTLLADKMCVEFDGLHEVTKGLKNYQIEYDEPLVVVRPDKGIITSWISVKNRKIPVVISNTFGKGRIVYIPARFDSIQCEKLVPAIEKLFYNSITWLAQGDIPVLINTPATVGVTLYDQPDRRLLHLLNYNTYTTQGYTPVNTVFNLKVKMIVPSGKNVSRLHLLMQKLDLQYDKNGKWIEFKLSKFSEYEVVVMEFK